MINPSEIMPETLPYLKLEQIIKLPKLAGIYFAIDSSNKVQYIGRTINFKQRWLQHHKYQELNAIGGIKIAYLVFSCPELLPEIEKALIIHFKPPLNSLIPNEIVRKTLKIKKPENLNKRTSGINKVPQVKVRLNQEQHEWLLNHVEDSGTNINAFLKSLVQKAMDADKRYFTNKHN